ncbi:MAG: hypothetical protein N3G20_03110, partial [Verrucomicrobiae bacterium]|nr:hypothetical protein [Verrucomicrobiae bacterium]
FLWRCEAMPPALNMAWDEVLLDCALHLEKPILRFYAWAQPAGTFGYFQKYETVQNLTGLRPLIRRPTGGGFVPHDNDWTYSLVIPSRHAWYTMAAGSTYARIHWWLHLAFKLLGLQTRLAPHQQDGRGSCFAGTARFDLLFNERKIAGAALRRTRHCILAQGSVQPLPFFPDRAEFEAALQIVGRGHLGIEWEFWTPTNDLIGKANTLATHKYSSDSYNKVR